MTNTRKIAELSRQELYELIWSLPAIKVAANFGISDVAVHKRCIKLQVPRPTRGYWAKVAAGQKPHKKPLPPTADEVFAKLVRRPIGKALSLPEAGVPLHPVAAELLQAIVKAKLDSQKRARISARTLPEVVISKNLADRVAKAFHVILTGLEPLGILFQKSLSTSQIGYFKRGQDQLYCYLEETRVDMFGTERRVQWWSSQECGLPSGRLIFSFKPAIYGNNEEKQWAETRRVSLEKVLARIVSGIRQHFLDMQKKHIQEAIENKIRQAEYEQRFREWQAAEEIRKQTEREQKHVEALKSVIDIATTKTRIPSSSMSRKPSQITTGQIVNVLTMLWFEGFGHLTD